MSSLGYRQVRWLITLLLFLSTAINYVDRQTLSVLSSTLRDEFGLTDSGYANAVTAFLFSYTAMYTLAGRWLDQVGLRAGIAACVVWWSLAGMLTAFARGAFSLAFARFLLGVGEPGIYPGGLKACAEWFPPKERALPTGIFSSGSALGAVIAPPLVAWIAISLGWRAAFLIPGLLGLMWVPLWLAVYREPSSHPAVSPADRAALLEGESVVPKRPWRVLIGQRRVWALLLPRLIADPVWYFYLFWLPDYLQRERHLSLAQIGFYGWIPFLFADLGNIGGGAASDWLVRRGLEPARARMAMLGVVGVLGPIGALVGVVDHVAAAIAVTCLIACLTQVWSTNTATLAADLFPNHERASVLGMMGTAGSLGGMIFTQALAIAIGAFGYGSAFVLAAILHPVAVMLLFILLRPGPRPESSVSHEMHASA